MMRHWLTGLLILLGVAGQASCAKALSSDCDLTGSHSMVDFGKVSQGELQSVPGKPGSGVMGKRFILLSAVCKSPQPITITLQAPEISGKPLPFGKDGVLMVRVLRARLDGQQVEPLKVGVDGGAHPVANGMPFWLFAGEGVTTQTPRATRFSLLLQVEPVVSMARHVEDERFDGVLPFVVS